MYLLYCLLFLLTIVYIAMGILYYTGLGKSRGGVNSRQRMVSVIVAARNEEKNIARCLESLLEQSYPTDAYEVIVIDDQSADRTGQIVTSYATTNNNLKLVSITQRKPGWSQKKFALTSGIEQSEGKIILTTDADCTVPYGWIEGMVRYFEDDVGVVGGYSRIDPHVDKRGVLHTIQSFDFFTLMCAAAGSIGRNHPLAVSGQNLGYRREAFDEIGGYEEVKNRVSGDDVLLLQLIARKTQWHVRFATSTETFVTTQPLPSLKGFLQQRSRWASNSLPQMILNPGFFLLLLSTFCFHLLLICLIPLSIFMHVSLLPVISVLLVKATVDSLVIRRGAHLFHRKGSLLPTLLLWEVVSLLLVIVSGILGIFGRFTWKDRMYRDQGW